MKMTYVLAFYLCLLAYPLQADNSSEVDNHLGKAYQLVVEGDMEQAKYAGSDPRRPSYQEANQMIPTPTAVAATQGQNEADGKRGQTLAGAARGQLWPTPTAMTDTGGAALCKWGGSGARAKLKTMVSKKELNGALNPQWVEWLMGFPSGWTDLEDSVTPSCPKSQSTSDG